ncbi:MAG: DUF3084 domain-containing protein [bacterium]|nr:DUF3084 domain-containing protein [bacterium]
MMETLLGILRIAFIVVLAGAIAFIGDRVGHQVGRRRMSLFGLRPKHTSTIVAVGFGMLIALGVTLAFLAASHYARTAFFRLSELNAQVASLQKQVQDREQELARTQNENLIQGNNQPITPTYAVVNADQSPQRIHDEVKTIFTNAVSEANRVWVPLGLKPYDRPVDDADHDKKFNEAATYIRRNCYPVAGIVFPVAAHNLFRGDRLSISLNITCDRLVYKKGQEIAAITVPGGAVPNIGYLLALTQQAANDHGMPAYTSEPFGNPSNLQTIQRELSKAKGKFRLVARAGNTVRAIGPLVIQLNVERME